jgi:hypothetical protein
LGRLGLTLDELDDDAVEQTLVVRVMPVPGRQRRLEHEAGIASPLCCAGDVLVDGIDEVADMVDARLPVVGNEGSWYGDEPSPTVG